MTQTISVSVPAIPAYLAAAEKFLTDCRLLAQANPDLVTLSENINTAVSNLQNLELDNSLEIPDVDGVFEETVEQVHVLEVPPAPPVAPVPPPTDPVYAPTEKLAGFTVEEMLGNGWTESALIEHGYIVEVKPQAPAAPTPPPPPVNSSVGAGVSTTAPMAPPHSGQTAAQSVELDAAGVPWDAEIHSSGKSRVADGTWTKKRGVDPTFYNNRVVQLKALVANGNGAPAVPAQPQTNAAPLPPANKAPVGQVSPGAQLIRDFNAAMKSSNGAINQQTFLAACKAHGVDEIKKITLPENIDKIPAIRKTLLG